MKITDYFDMQSHHLAYCLSRSNLRCAYQMSYITKTWIVAAMPVTLLLLMMLCILLPMAIWDRKDMSDLDNFRFAHSRYYQPLMILC